MTTIVTRLYADAKTAGQAATALKLQGHPDANIDVIEYGEGAKAAMIAARVPEESATAYSRKMTKGNTLVVCRAPITPFGAARNAIDTFDEFDGIDAGVENESVYLREGPEGDMFLDMKVDRTHRLWATWGNERRRGLISDAFGLRTLSPHKTHRSAWSGTHFVSRAFWPMPLLSQRKPNAVISGTRYMSQYFFPAPLISRRTPNVNVS